MILGELYSNLFFISYSGNFLKCLILIFSIASMEDAYRSLQTMCYSLTRSLNRQRPVFNKESYCRYLWNWEIYDIETQASLNSTKPRRNFHNRMKHFRAIPRWQCRHSNPTFPCRPAYNVWIQMDDNRIIYYMFHLRFSCYCYGSLRRSLMFNREKFLAVRATWLALFYYC